MPDPRSARDPRNHLCGVPRTRRVDEKRDLENWLHLRTKTATGGALGPRRRRKKGCLAQAEGGKDSSSPKDPYAAWKGMRNRETGGEVTVKEKAPVWPLCEAAWGDYSKGKWRGGGKDWAGGPGGFRSADRGLYRWG